MSTIVRTFYAAPGSRLKDSDADIVGRYVTDKLNGVVSAVEFVKAAKAVSSPLHPYLEWDDKVAAHEYRLAQARIILHSICVYDEGAPEEKIRAFHKVAIADNGGVRSAYVAHDIVWQRPELVQQVVEQALRELEAFTRKYRVYDELSHVVAVIEDIVASKV